MADVVNFPKRYTSYRVAFLPFKDSPILHFMMQCPYDKLEEFLTKLFSMPPDEAFYYEVHGMLADGQVDLVRGDISVDAPRGRMAVRHSGLVFPGSSLADDIAAASARYISEEREKLTAGVKRRNSLTNRGGTPASTTPSISQQATLDHIESYKNTQSSDSLMDRDGKPRFRWDAQRAEYVEKDTGRAVTQTQWSEMRERREAAKLNRPLAVLPSAEVVSEALKKIADETSDPLSVFPVVLTSIEIEEFK